MRFIFTGPESSGKTTFAEKAQKKWGGGLVMEKARPYLNNQNGKYTFEDLLFIGQSQLKEENDIAKNHPVIWCDTDLTTVIIWAQDKFDKVDPTLIKKMNDQNTFERFYFLCFPDIPWEADPLRENPFDRDRIFRLYEKHLIKNQLKYCILKGNEEEKFNLIEKYYFLFG